jgi:predicted GIY-YIG superfamily endonuclease
MTSRRVEYPDYITQLRDDGRSIFYVISKESGYYKFGITTTLLTRMKKHYRDFQFTRIDAIIDCGCDAIMRAVETEFKQESAKTQILVTRYEKTEVVAVPDITPYLAWIRGKIAVMAKSPQPPNNRGDAKKEKKYKAELLLLKQLHEQDRKEIETLREKIRILEELVKKGE